MQRLIYTKAVSVVCALFLSTAAYGATSQGNAPANDTTWFSLLNASGRTSSSVASAASLDGSPIDALFEPRTMNAAQRIAIPPSGSAELMGSLVACGLLYRILRRRRVL